MELSVETFDLKRFVDEVVATAQPLMSNKQNRLEVHCSEGLGLIASDATKLRQAALNLLSNAAKFTTNGVITLSVHRDKKAAGDWIDIQVRDTGIGIAKTDLPKLFQNFGQATASTSSKFGGTGPRTGAQPEALRADGRRHFHRRASLAAAPVSRSAFRRSSAPRTASTKPQAPDPLASTWCLRTPPSA